MEPLELKITSYNSVLWQYFTPQGDYVTFKVKFSEEEYSMGTLSHAKFGLIGEGRGYRSPRF